MLNERTKKKLIYTFFYVEKYVKVYINIYFLGLESKHILKSIQALEYRSIKLQDMIEYYKYWNVNSI